MEVIDRTTQHSSKQAEKLTATKSKKAARKKRRINPSVTKPQIGIKPERHFNFDEIDLAPMERLRTPNYSHCRKVLWGLVLTACTAACIWHLCNRIRHYIHQPTSFDVSVEHKQQVQLPAVTLCPLLYVEFDQNGKTVNGDTYWKDTLIENSIRILASCIPTDGVCKNYSTDGTEHTFSIKNDSIATILGHCLVMQPDFLLDYRGQHTGIGFDLSNVAKHIGKNDKNRTATIFLHSQGPVYRHDVYYLSKPLYYGHDTELEVTLKKFQYLSRGTNACMTEDALVECRNKCIDKLLEDYTECRPFSFIWAKTTVSLSYISRLPFMTFSELPQCNISKEELQPLYAAFEFYDKFNFSRCHCGKACEEKIYISSQDVDANAAGKTTLTILYTNNVVETVTERDTYSFGELLSDIGAGLGFVLGCCIFTFLELLECTFDVIYGHVVNAFKSETLKGK